MKIKILSVGKKSQRHVEDLVQEYVKRLSSQVHIEMIWVKNADALLQQANKEKQVIALDENGISMSSQQFATYLQEGLEQGGSSICFLIGGAEGLPSSIKQAYPLLSFSKMTMPHQLIRVFLIEQIYRAFEIGKNSAYHK